MAAPKYKLKKDHYLHHRYSGDKFATPRHHLAGETVEYDGKPSLSMAPIGKDAEERVKARTAERSEEHKKIRENAARSFSGWSPSMERSFMKTLSGSDDLPKDQPVDALAVRDRAKRNRATA